MTDNSLSDLQALEVREEILSQSDTKVLAAYFSYSGTTRNVANAISEKTGGDLFEINLQDGYSNVYMESNSEIRNNERPASTRYYEADIRRYFQDAFGYEGSVSESADKMTELFESLGADMYFDGEVSADLVKEIDIETMLSMEELWKRK